MSQADSVAFLIGACPSDRVFHEELLRHRHYWHSLPVNLLELLLVSEFRPPALPLVSPWHGDERRRRVITHVSVSTAAYRIDTSMNDGRRHEQVVGSRKLLRDQLCLLIVDHSEQFEGQ